MKRDRRAVVRHIHVVDPGNIAAGMIVKQQRRCRGVTIRFNNGIADYEPAFQALQIKQLGPHAQHLQIVGDLNSHRSEEARQPFIQMQ